MKTRILLIAIGLVAVVAAVFLLVGPVTAPSTEHAEVAVTAVVRGPTGVPNTATPERVAAVVAAATPEATPPPQPESPLLTPTTENIALSPLAVPGTGSAPVYTYEVVAEYPSDPDAWTQGLVYTNGVLYVGTGLHGQSSVRKTDLESGEVLQYTALPDEYFGEGVTVLGDKAYQLTWKQYQAVVYDADDLTPLAVFSVPTEGWGLTHDGERLIMSDGTAVLYSRDPETLEETGRVLVQDNNVPVIWLNELEYVNGEVFANVWQTDWIARIDPATGKVVGWINLTGLLGPEYRQGRVAELNGIAYDAENDRLFVTGKLWPRLFEIDLIPVE